jgi:hypothetical protein
VPDGANTAGAVSGPYEMRLLTYILRSANQQYDNALRILVPDNLDRVREPRVVYVLPAAPHVNVIWNDGLLTIQALDLHNRFGMIAVAPSFSDWPWYADHPENPSLRQETYFNREVVPFVDWLFPMASAKRLLLGFSKSGFGAFTLLLRRPDLYHAAAIWDAPLMKEAPDQFEMPQIYGSRENFERYHVPRLLEERAALLRMGGPRLALSGQGFFGGPDPRFGEHTQAAHELMERLRIPHLYENSTSRAHRWDSGWMEWAVEALDRMSSGDGQ